jgi:hypothetical protein
MTWKLAVFAAAIALAFAQAPSSTLRGRLLQAGEKPAIETRAGARIELDGEPESLAVLRDRRLAGAELELRGEHKKPNIFIVGSFYTSKSMFVHKDGKKYTISYWCPVCSIRTYTPGKCMCCQEETHLDLEEAR